MRKILLGILIIVLAIAAYVVSNLVSKEYKEWEQDPQYLLDEAMGGDKLYEAAEKILIKTTGKTPEKLKNWREFEPKNTDKNQILFIFKQQLKTEAEQDKLLDWVAQGNHLVTPVEIAYQLRTWNENDEEEEVFGLGDRVSVFREDELKHLPVHIMARNNRLKPHPLCIKESLAKEEAWKAVGSPLQFSAKTYEHKSLQELSTIAEQKLSETEGPTKRRVAESYYQINSLIRCTLRLNELRLPEGETMYVSTNVGGMGSDALVYFGKAKPIFESMSPTGSDIIKISHGKGTITFVADSGLFKNPNVPTMEDNSIRQFDHAWFLTYLVQGKDKILFLPKAKDFVQKQKNKPSLLKKLISDAPELTAAVFLLGALFVWQKAWRHGTILAPINVARRRLSEHFHAQGEFVRRHSGLNTVLSQLQEDLWQRISRRIPNIQDLPLERKVAELKRLTGLSSADLMYLLKPLPTKLSPFDLVKYVISLQKIRNKL